MVHIVHARTDADSGGEKKLGVTNLKSIVHIVHKLKFIQWWMGIQYYATWGVTDWCGLST